MSNTAVTPLSDAIGSLMSTVRSIEAEISLPMHVDDVEGRRFLLRMLSASVDTFVEHADADRPRFHHAEGPTRKMFADCPDTDYLRAPIRLGPGRAYRLSGRIPEGVLYMGVLLYGRGGRVARSLTDRELGCDAEGRFEMVISTEPHEGTWLEAEGDENAVMVRQYFLSRDAEPTVEIELTLLGEATPPTTLDADWMAGQLQRSERMLEAIFSRTLQGYKLASVAAVNHFIEVPAKALFPTPDNDYRACWFRLEDDQVLLVRGQLPPARYFGLSLCNAWMESFDYLNHPRSNLNHSQIVADDAGKFEVVLAHRDPGHPNWVDIAGHGAGFLLARYLLLDGEPPGLETHVCSLAEFADHRQM